jgi:hypothetical protein
LNLKNIILQLIPSFPLINFYIVFFTSSLVQTSFVLACLLAFHFTKSNKHHGFKGKADRSKPFFVQTSSCFLTFLIGTLGFLKGFVLKTSNYNYLEFLEL